jgi:hypothetical protein
MIQSPLWERELKGEGYKSIPFSLVPLYPLPLWERELKGEGYKSIPFSLIPLYPLPLWVHPEVSP